MNNTKEKNMDNTNALAELAEDLEVVKAILDWEYHPKGLTVAEKAQRIVAELAKFTDTDYFSASEAQMFDILSGCRAIAKEGGNDAD